MRPCPGRSATNRSGRTCASRRYGSVTPTGSSSPTTPKPPSATRSKRRPPGRRVPAALLRPAPERRGHRPGLQAAAGGRTGLAGEKADHRPAARLPPTRGTHPLPHGAVLARSAPHPHHRDAGRCDLDPGLPRDPASARGAFTGPNGAFLQVNDLTKLHADLLAKLGVPRPKQALDLQPASH